MELNSIDEDKMKDQGMDIADFLERYPSKEFIPKLLIPTALKAPPTIPSTYEAKSTSEIHKSAEQTAIYLLTAKYPGVKALVKRLELHVKKVSPLSSQDGF